MNGHQKETNGIKVMVENDKVDKYKEMNSEIMVWISLETTRLVKEEIGLITLMLSRGHHHCLHRQ